MPRAFDRRKGDRRKSLSLCVTWHAWKDYRPTVDLRASGACRTVFEVGGSNRAIKKVRGYRTFLECMARFEESTSNELFETLEEWNDYLERDVPYFRGPEL